MTFDKTAIMYLGILGAILVVVAGGVWYAQQEVRGSIKPQNEFIRISETVEGVGNFTTLTGEAVDLSDYAGKPLVVNSWATWCPFCVNELPDFAVLAREFAGSDVTVIAINRKEDAAVARSYLESQITADLDPIVFLLDREDRFYTSIGGFSMPETVFYDRDGNVVVHKRGFMALPEMRTHIEATLTVSNSLE